MKMIKQYFIFLILLISQITSSMLFAEGTKQIKKQATDVAGIVIYESNAGRPFANYDCAPENRLNIRINEVGEVVNYGFQCLPDVNSPSCTNPLKYRVKDPNGTVLFEYAMPTTGQQGYINSYAEAVAGPSNITVGGYNALSFTPTMTGDYSIEFEKVSQTCINYGLNYTFIDHFDITVSKNNNAIDGRLWSQSWQLTTQKINNKFNGDFYVYSDDHIVTKIDFEGLQPIVFTIAANSFGASNTGFPLTDRKSLDNVNAFANPGIPQYKIFLNDPDINCFPSGVFGDFDSDITVVNNSVTPCGREYCVNVNVTQAGHLDVLLDFNGTPGYQANTTDVKIGADVVAGHNCIKWDGKDGLGNLITEANNVVVVADYINGLTNLPLYDVELNTIGFSVTLIRPTTLQPPNMYWDDSNINLPGGIFGDMNLTGSTGFCHSWSTYAANDSSYQDYGNKNTINTWWYSSKTSKTAVLNIPPIMAPPVLKYCSTKGMAVDLSIGNGKTYIWYKDSSTTIPINSTIPASTGETVSWNPAGSSGDHVFYINLPPALPFSNLGPTTLDYTSWNGNPGTKLQILTSSKVILKSVDIETGWGTGCGNNDTISINTTPVQSVIVKTTCGAAKKTVNLDFLLDMGGLYTLTSSNRLKYSITSGITSIQDVVRIIPFKVENTTSTYTAFANMKFITPPGCEPIPIKVNLKDTCCSPATITIQPINDTLCVDGTSKAAFSITATTASGIISYQWQTDNGTGMWTDITNAISSTYQTPVVTTNMNNYKYKCIVYLDGSCPKISDVVTLKTYAIPTASITGQSSICTGASTTLSANGAGTYQWDNGSTAATYNVSPTTTTNYTLTVSGNGCTKTTQFTVNVNSLPTVDAGANLRICRLMSVQPVPATDPTWTCKWSSSSSDGHISNKNICIPSFSVNDSANLLADKVFKYILEVTDTKGCRGKDSMNVTFEFSCKPFVQLSATPDSICRNQSTSIAAVVKSDKGVKSFQWSEPSFTNLNGPFTVTPAATITYMLTVTDNDDKSNADTVVVKVNQLPVADAGADQEKCFGQKANLSANAGFSAYKWSTNETTPQITTPAITQTSGFTVTVTDIHGCTDDASVTVVMNPLPVLSFISIPDQCVDKTAYTLNTGSGTPSGGTALYKGTAVTAGVFNPSAAGAGTYMLKYIYTEPLKGCMDSTTQTVTVQPLPVVNLTAAEICRYQTATVDAGDASRSYLWNDPSSTTSHLLSVSPANSTVYTVTVTDNQTQCSNKAGVTVTVNQLPVPVINGMGVCSGKNAVLTASGADNGGHYLWDDGTQTNPKTVKPLVNTTYFVTAYNASGCSDSTHYVMIVSSNPVPQISTAKQRICSGSSAVLTGSGGTGYLWSNQQTTDIITVNPAVTTQFTVTVTNAANCTATDTLTVQVIQPPQNPQMDDAERCSNDPIIDITLKIPDTKAGYVYRWYSSLTGNTLLNQGISYTEKQVDTSHTYYIETISPDSCHSTMRRAVNINWNQPPVASFYYEPVGVSMQNTKVQMINQSLNAVKYWWNFGRDEGFSDLKEPFNIFSDTGLFRIVLTAISVGGCKSKDSSDIYIKKRLLIWLPDVFTPNNDGKNDVFYVRGPVKVMKLEIYNEWGYMVFKSEKQNDGWDGKYKGADQPEGNYLWTLEATTTDEQQMRNQGMVILIR